MRFDTIKKFTVAELLLDQGNYRFKSADDQDACISKIYHVNPAYFKGLMESIAEDDLGEPLLVYQNEKAENVVADGNRRLSVLKVLSDEACAPNESIAKYAAEIKSKYSYKEKKIQAQFSDDKRLIAKTVFERHSGGKNGTTRIPWNAYAAARFGFDEKMGSDKDWRIMALLSLVESRNQRAAKFINTNKFSFDIFRRIIRAALKQKIISEVIFTERGERIKRTARKDLVQDAVTKTVKFLRAMKDKRLTLSRKDEGLYADEKNVSAFLLDFNLSPDNQEIEDAKPANNDDHDSDYNDAVAVADASDADTADAADDDNSDASASDDTGASDYDDNEGKSGDGSSARNIGIEQSDEISSLLNKLRSKKLTSLYYSLCTLSLKSHPTLLYVGAWCFLEVLARKVGSGKTDFPAFFNNRSKQYGFSGDTKKDCGAVMSIISKYGNLAKHSHSASTKTAENLRDEFKTLEPLIVAALKEAIENNSK